MASFHKFDLCINGHNKLVELYHKKHMNIMVVKTIVNSIQTN